MLFIALLALLGLGLIAAVIIAISTRHLAAILAAIMLATVLFLLLVWPGWLRLAIWPPTGAGGDNGPVTTSACADPGNMIERDVLPDGTNSLVCGPAIYEQPGVVGKVDAGTTVVLTKGLGSWWSFPTQASLDSRWPSHLREFLAKCQTDGWNCVVNGPRPESDAVAPVYVAGPANPIAPPTVAACDKGEYIVAQGDSLSGIAQALGLDWQVLAARNGVYAPYTIRPGQTLCLP